MHTQTSTSSIVHHAIHAARDVGYAVASHSSRRSAASVTKSVFTLVALAALPAALLGVHRTQKAAPVKQKSDTLRHLRKRALPALAMAVLVFVISAAVIAPKALPGLLLMAVILL